MRFAGPRAEGLRERDVAEIDEGYASSSLRPAEVAALRLTDSIIGASPGVPDALKEELRRHFSDAEIAELTLGVGLFAALSKTLIALGLEPESMPVSVLPTPGDSPAETHSAR